MVRNIIHPGWIVSPTDGDRHFIGFAQLVRLYKLDPKTCFMYNERKIYAGNDYRHYYPDATGEAYA